MIEDSVALPQRTQAMEDHLAGTIRCMEHAGIVVYLNGDTTLGFNGSNANMFKNHLIGTITGHDGPFSVIINGISLNNKYNKNTNIRIGIGLNNNYDSGCYIQANCGVMNFLSVIINCVEYYQV
jgi:hypothetical protein